MSQEHADAEIGEKDPGSMPSADEEAAAERAEGEQPDIEDTYRDMTEKGATAEGEGAID